MKTAIFTLFEKEYHYGVAALVNSLVANEFIGVIYVGYKGDLPFWTEGKIEAYNGFKIPNKSLKMKLNNDVSIIFVPLQTHYHLTNYKAHFIVDILENETSEIKEIFYFDPDIVILAPFHFFKKWISFGIAVVHEISWNDMPNTHPKRKMWLEIAESAGLNQKNTINSYINAGYFGLKFNDLEFIKLLRFLIDFSIKNYQLNPEKFSQANHDFGYFKVADQDLFNLALMCTDSNLSEMGPESMHLIPGGYIMAHAVGSPKPWNYREPKHFLSGLQKNMALKLYWLFANGLIKPYKNNYIRYKKVEIKLYSFLSRFYKK